MTNDRLVYILPLVNYNLYWPIISHLYCTTSFFNRSYKLHVLLFEMLFLHPLAFYCFFNNSYLRQNLVKIFANFYPYLYECSLTLPPPPPSSAVKKTFRDYDLILNERIKNEVVFAILHIYF